MYARPRSTPASYIRSAALLRPPALLRDPELPGQSLRQHLAHVLARAPLPALLRSVQVPVRSVQLRLLPRALLAPLLAAPDALQLEGASTAGVPAAGAGSSAFL